MGGPCVSTPGQILLIPRRPGTRGIRSAPASHLDCVGGGRPARSSGAHQPAHGTPRCALVPPSSGRSLADSTSRYRCRRRSCSRTHHVLPRPSEPARFGDPVVSVRGCCIDRPVPPRAHADTLVGDHYPARILSPSDLVALPVDRRAHRLSRAERLPKMQYPRGTLAKE